MRVSSWKAFVVLAALVVPFGVPSPALSVEINCNMVGVWDAQFWERVGLREDIVSITVKDGKIIGRKSKGPENIGAGRKTLRGDYVGNGLVANLEYKHPQFGWLNAGVEPVDGCAYIMIKAMGSRIYMSPRD